MSFTTEFLLESATAGFGFETLSPLQRAKARLLDGLPLGELAERSDVHDLVGCDPTLLPTERPVEVIDVCGIRTLKTTGCAAKCIELSQNVDVSPVRSGEVPHIFWLSTTMAKASPGFNMLVSTIMGRKALRALVVGEPTSDSITLRHPSGVPIRIVVTPASRAGATLVGVWCAGAVFDEAARWQSTDDGHVITLEECRAAVRGRLLPRAQLFYPGSPWAPDGFVYKCHADRHGKPGADMVVLHADARALWPEWWTDERCAEVKAASPRTYAMDIEAKFGATDSTAYDLRDVEASGADLGPLYGNLAMGGTILTIDLGQLVGAQSDGSGVAVMSWCRPRRTRVPATYTDAYGLQQPVLNEYGQRTTIKLDDKPLLVVHHAETWRDRPKLDDVESRIARICDRYRPQRAFSDRGGDVGALDRMFRQRGLQFEAWPLNSAPRREAYEWIGRLLADRSVRIPSAEMRADLLRIQMRMQPGGQIQYFARRTAAGHAELASCLVAYAMAETHGMMPDSPHRLGGGRHVVPGA